MICEGGYFVGPEKNYWRINEYSRNVIRCLNEEACMGAWANSTAIDGLEWNA